MRFLQGAEKQYRAVLAVNLISELFKVKKKPGVGNMPFACFRRGEGGCLIVEAKIESDLTRYLQEEDELTNLKDSVPLCTGSRMLMLRASNGKKIREKQNKNRRVLSILPKAARWRALLRKGSQ